MAHALLGPSSANRWLNCPGSARATEHIVESESEFAKEGTTAHAVAEMFLLNASSGKKRTAELKKMRETMDIDGEMEGHAFSYMKYVDAIKGELLVEQKLTFDKYVPEGFGTGDAIKVSDDVLHVIDFKYGKGVPVTAEDNLQLKMYALGAIEALGMLYDFSHVTVHIFQPRLGDPTTADYTVDEIMEWAETIKVQAQKAWDGVQEFKSGSWCKFCKINGNCKTRMEEEAQKAFSDVFIEPEDVVGVNPNTMSDDEIVYWLGVADGVQKFLSDLKDYAEKEAINHGKTWEGYKVVEGRSNRVYSNEDEVRVALRKAEISSEVFLQPAKLLGITALEKAIGKKVFEEIVGPHLIKPPGKPTLVPLSDKREPLNSTKDVFND